MKKTRVLLVDLPRVTRDMVSGLLDGRQDIEIVGDCVEADLARAVERLHPSAVVMATSEAELPESAVALLDERSLHVVVITNRGGVGVLAELVPHQALLGLMDGDALVRVLEEARA